MHGAFQSVERKTVRDLMLLVLMDQLVTFLGVLHLLSLLVMLVIKAKLS